jgi:hypothetical protein
MANYLPIILIAVFFVLSFFVKRPRMRPVIPVICGACAAFFIVMVFTDEKNRFASFFFAILSMFLMVKYLRAPKPLSGLDE